METAPTLRWQTILEHNPGDRADRTRWWVPISWERRPGEDQQSPPYGVSRPELAEGRRQGLTRGCRLIYSLIAARYRSAEYWKACLASFMMFCPNHPPKICSK